MFRCLLKQTGAEKWQKTKKIFAQTKTKNYDPRESRLFLLRGNRVFKGATEFFAQIFV
jgi:hypothetical protein